MSGARVPQTQPAAPELSFWGRYVFQVAAEGANQLLLSQKKMKINNIFLKK